MKHALFGIVLSIVPTIAFARDGWNLWGVYELIGMVVFFVIFSVIAAISGKVTITWKGKVTTYWKGRVLRSKPGPAEEELTPKKVVLSSTPATLHAGTDNGGGVLKNINGGTTWQPTGASSGNGAPLSDRLPKITGL